VGSIPLARVHRSGLEESVHHGDVAVATSDGRLTRVAGDPGRMVYARSCMKPLQAAVSLSHLETELPDEEVAVACASHNGEPVHVETVRSLLARTGVPETALRCPSVRPWDDEAAAAAPEKRTVNSDCSGKHAAMLAACRRRGWPLDEYTQPEHPLQQDVLRWVLSASGRSDVRVGVDGCGVPVHGFPLGAMATLYARLADPRELGELGPWVRRATGAMRAAPYLVAGRKRTDTAVMEAVPGVVMKSGAEGLICAAVPDQGLGVAVKIRDGNHRAAAPAIIRTLQLLGVVSDEHGPALREHARPLVFGGGRDVGEIASEFQLRDP
jgi:L-asparaginase II